MIAIYTLWVREVKKYFRSKSRIIGSLGQPILFLLALGFGLGPVFKAAGQGDYVQFLVPGIISMSILFLAVFSGISVIWDRQFGFLKETMVAPVPRWQIMLGRTLGGATVAVMQGIIVFLISLLLGFHMQNAGLLVLAFVFMIMIALLFTAVGTAIASVLEDMHGFQLIMNFLVMPIFFLSGALFPLKNLPSVLEVVVKFDPLTYGVDGLRGTLGGVAEFGLFTDFWIMLGIVFVVIAIGSYLFSKIQV
ncbi:MAG: ABC transporter permease [Candidatus Staskawiczbacteria bacterium]|nr:ABC transporter permease [Candidatus Staskawiczbacteria bacterium]